MADDNEVFFIDSPVSDDGPDGRNGSASARLRRRAHSSDSSNSSNSEDEKAGYPAPSASSLTMEEILYGPAPSRSRPASPFAQSQRQNGSHANHPSTGGLFTSASDATPHTARNEMHFTSSNLPCAGGSPCAMPAQQPCTPPRTLAELRAMTSSDVREELERFFVRKETLAKHFKTVEATLCAPHQAGAASEAHLPAPSSSASSSPSTTAELLALDRCRRLVNVSNWDSAVNGYSKWDVLLPAALLPDVEPSTTPTSSRRRTLRPHQVEGIRFLWSILAEGPVGQVPAVGCILAHTMGLGKTGQVVVFLHLFMAAFRRQVSSASMSSTRAEGSSTRPPRALIVIPKSTQSGWKREFQTWSHTFPNEYHIRPLSIEETIRPRQRVDIFQQWRRDGGVLLIGYEALVRLLQLVETESVWTEQPQHRREHERNPFDTAHPDRDGQATARDQHRRDLLQRHTDEGEKAFGGSEDPFTELVICDEAHRLKSVHLRIVQALRGLHPLRRMLLTGTPLQNHLHEYWAMMDFCVHKYFSRRRFREYFIQPIESSATTRASEKEVDLARKKTFTLISEVRHFVQRVDSTPLRKELPPLHEYVVVLPPSPLQRELYLRFIQIVQHDGSQRLQFLPAVSYSGKIAAHPQLLFQMRDQLAATSASRNGAAPRRGEGGGGSRPVAGKKRVSDYWALEKRNRQESSTNRTREQMQQQQLSQQPAVKSKPLSDESDDEDEKENSADAVVISDSDGSESSSDIAAEAKAEDEEEKFTRVTQQSFSALCPAPLTYEELCIPPSPTYVPRLEEGVKLYTAMKLIAAAIAQGEKTLFFSLSTQLLTFFEFMVAKVNIEWCRPPDTDTEASYLRLKRPIRYCRLDGSHTAAQRAAMLEEFDRADGPDLFLLSMKAGGVGITITAATRVILVDTSFNPADDQQAIGRAYRYGQTRPVYVYRLMCYPTLEYSIFVQKLAKEWLFKTVVEESSVKRDGLSGMHLKELFSLLTRAAKVLEKPPVATRTQVQTTTDVLRDDPLLGTVQANLLYAQRYEMFLEQDSDDRYGEAEEEFYKDYCRSRLFDTADDDNSEKRRAADALLRHQQRVNDATQLRAQSKTLTSMVDDLIRSRADTDPHLTRLLSAMGLHVDPANGQVRTSRSGGQQESNNGATGAAVSGARNRAMAPPLEQSDERFAPAPVVLVGGANVRPMQRLAQHEGGTDEAATTASQPQQHSPSASRLSQAHNSHQTAVLLLDSDDEASASLPLEESHNVEHRNGGPPVNPTEQIAASLSRQPYARYRPGGSPSRAVEVDSDGSQ